MLMRTSQDIRTLTHKISRVFSNGSKVIELWLGRPIELEIYPEETIYASLKVEKASEKMFFNLARVNSADNILDEADFTISFSCLVKQPSSENCDKSFHNVIIHLTI